MKVINLYGGAGAGKSTLASALFCHLRLNNQINCEILPEFAKEVVYEGNRRNLSDQLYLLGNQQHRLRRLQDSGIEVAICDSPIDMSILYGIRMGLSCDYISALETIVYTLNKDYDRFNIFVHRQVEGNFRKNKKWSTEIDELIQRNIIMDTEVSFDDLGVKLLCYSVDNWLLRG